MHVAVGAREIRTSFRHALWALAMPVLLIAGEQDAQWNSARQARNIVAAREAHGPMPVDLFREDGEEAFPRHSEDPCRALLGKAIDQQRGGAAR